MKTSIIMIDGVTQIALHPETDTEKRVCEMLREPDKCIEIVQGNEIIETRGNYLRQSANQATCIVIREATRP